MHDLYKLHSKMYAPLKSSETIHNREIEFNYLIEEYELDAASIAKYLLEVRSTTIERKNLIHKLIPDNFEFAEALLELANCYEKFKD